MSDGEDGSSPDCTSGDPRRIRALAVHTDDVLTALEARERGRRRTVLRVTPPFAGRIRARLHVEGDGTTDDREDAPLHLNPGAFVDDVPPFPTVDETEDELRERGEYSVERHREAHAEAVAGWREAVRESLRDRLPVEAPDGDHEVRVAYLG